MLQTVAPERTVNASSLTERFRQRQRGALARLLTFIENGHPVADAVLDAVHSSTGDAWIIGVTGPPGAGKSTLTNALIGALRATGKTVGVLAVDPSSALTGGATLGDRIRMLETYDDDGVYIRSMATRGQYGGLTLATNRATLALDAFGFDVIILETVGVGQDEVDIASQADTTILLQVPGLGDAIQTIKAGILEIADIIVVNKAEQPASRSLQRDLRAMLRFRGHLAWTPPVVPTVATTGEGIDDLINEIERHRAYLEQSGEGSRRRQRRIASEMRRIARHHFESQISDYLDTDDGKQLIGSVATGALTPHMAAWRVVSNLTATSPAEDRSQ